MPRTRSFSASTAPHGATRRNSTPISIASRKPEKRDHRKIGKELELFTFSPDVGAGLPLWMPNGMVIRQELEFLALQEERKDGYKRVATPHITKEALYYPLAPPAPTTTEDMYSPLDIDGENYYLRADELPASSHDLSGDAAFLSRAAAAPRRIRPVTTATKRRADCRA